MWVTGLYNIIEIKEEEEKKKGMRDPVQLQ